MKPIHFARRDEDPCNDNAAPMPRRRINQNRSLTIVNPIIERLIQLDETESAKQRDRVAFLALMDAVMLALPDGLVVTDAAGAIVLFNPRAEAMFGRHRSEVIGKPVETLLPHRMRALHAKHRDFYNRFEVSPHARTMGIGLQLTGLRSDGYEFPVDITLARMIVPDGVFNLALVRLSPRSLEPPAGTEPRPDSCENAGDANAGQ